MLGANMRGGERLGEDVWHEERGERRDEKGERKEEEEEERIREE